VVVVGASVAGLSAAGSFRRRGCSGEILLVGAAEKPRDSRPPWPKQILLGPAQAAADGYLPLAGSLGIETLARRRAGGLDFEHQVVAQDNSEFALSSTAW
jgi:NADPH-dependent 2,4-dienoyl-CoA reductase/sulfur reductase-like enzyme